MQSKAIILSDKAAKRFKQEPTEIESGLFDLSRGIDELHAKYPSHSSEHFSFAAARAIWRASMAPIIFDAEVLLRTEIDRRTRAGEPLAPPKNQQNADFDQLFRLYGHFDGKPLAFLRAMSTLSDVAMSQAIEQYKQVDIGQTPPLLRLFEESDGIVGCYFRDRGEHFPLLEDAERRLGEFAVTANVTALNIIAPAAHFTSLWSPLENVSITTAILDNVATLALPQYTTGALHEKHLPNYNQDYIQPDISPFSMTPEQVAEHGIWRLASLQKPWAYKRWCPATISFDPLLSTAATMRIEAAAKVADGILWSAG